jgi:hypothetical protein
MRSFGRSFSRHCHATLAMANSHIVASNLNSNFQNPVLSKTEVNYGVCIEILIKTKADASLGASTKTSTYMCMNYLPQHSVIIGKNGYIKGKRPHSLDKLSEAVFS